MLKVALNRAFHADRVLSDSAWRKVKPVRKVDEAVVRYLRAAEARRVVRACPEDFRKLVQAALVTGCRYSELARLKCGNFNRDRGTPLPDGRKLVSLREATDYITGLPKNESDLPEWEACRREWEARSRLRRQARPAALTRLATFRRRAYMS
jgi:integrase